MLFGLGPNVTLKLESPPQQSLDPANLEIIKSDFFILLAKKIVSKNLGLKNFWKKRNVGFKEYLNKTKVWVQRYLNKKIFWVKKNLFKIFVLQAKVLFKINVLPKKWIGVQKKLMVLNSFGSKEIFGQHFFGLNKFKKNPSKRVQCPKCT